MAAPESLEKQEVDAVVVQKPNAAQVQETQLLEEADQQQIVQSEPEQQPQNVQPASGDVHHSWGYVGDEAAPYWGMLDDAYEACGKGKAQSPINIAQYAQKDLPALEADYKVSPLSILNNRRTGCRPRCSRWRFPGRLCRAGAR